ncbi:MAG: VWA domain-containing protein [Anaerolineae bacterium]|nr:VWA domain-containing protein [Anaerolineae bacterium]
MRTAKAIITPDSQEISLEPLGPGHGHLLRNMVLFGRMLRALGIKVTPTQILDLVDGLQHIDMRRREDFKNTAQTILVSRFEHLELFNRAFDLFWQARDETELLEMDLGTLRRKPPQPKPEDLEPVEPGAKGDGSERESENPIIDTVYTYSAREVLRQKDFADLTPDELQEIKHLMQAMVWQLEQRRTRRRVRAQHGAYPDMRRTFRQNLRFGGEPLQLTWRRRKLKRRPLVVICDISGSMERYSRVLLKFIYAISNGLEKVEAFVFSTRLTRITHHLKNKDIDAALDQATLSIHDWAGGTRIGESLKTFNYEWGRRVLGQGAIVLLISDGWDRGDIDLLEREMNRLQLSCHRLIWLNPLLGSENYEPLTRGIQTALPYIDDFMPVHNLKSLEQLGSLLERLSEHRPERRQHASQRQAD